MRLLTTSFDENYFVSFSKVGSSAGLLLRVNIVLVASCKSEELANETHGTYQTLALGMPVAALPYKAACIHLTRLIPPSRLEELLQNTLLQF